jgi:hypothetical protein
MNVIVRKGFRWVSAEIIYPRGWVCVPVMEDSALLALAAVRDGAERAAIPVIEGRFHSEERLTVPGSGFTSFQFACSSGYSRIEIHNPFGHRLIVSVVGSRRLGDVQALVIPAMDLWPVGMTNLKSDLIESPGEFASIEVEAH